MKKKSVTERVFKFLASIQLAIFTLVSLAFMSAAGTILEARYDANYAQKVIYQSPFMYFILGLLCINLLNVIVDRWPWKSHHAGFILAHVGIILLVFGSWVTHQFGLDGSLAFDIGQSNRYVVLQENEVAVYESFIDGTYRLVHSVPVDFLSHPPQKRKFEVVLGGKTLKATDYSHYAVRSEKVGESKSDTDGPALRVQLQNKNVNLIQWLSRGANKDYEVYNLGPAKIVIAGPHVPYAYTGGNEIVIRDENRGGYRYEIFTKSRGGRTSSGVLPLGEAIETGWMGLQLRLLKAYSHAQVQTEYSPRERPTGLSTSAVKFEFGGKDYWLGLNSNVRLQNEGMTYVLTYRNRMVDIGFDMALEDFAVKRYQGSSRAMSYESTVRVPDLGTRKISMNEPLKFNGYTFYQASFQEDGTGRATTSVLSVNRDPGRPLKYLGSLLIVLGTIVMFYFKKYRLKIFGAKSCEKEALA